MTLVTGGVGMADDFKAVMRIIAHDIHHIIEDRIGDGFNHIAIGFELNSPDSIIEDFLIPLFHQGAAVVFKKTGYCRAFIIDIG